MIQVEPADLLRAGCAVVARQLDVWGGLFTVMGKIGKGSRLHWVGWLLFLGGGKIAGSREWRPLFGCAGLTCMQVYVGMCTTTW